MELKYRLYPHPVLWDAFDDYKTSHFNSEIKFNPIVKRIQIACSFDVDNSEMCELLKREEIEFVAHIECPLTSYRTILCTSSESVECEIKESELNGKVSICTFIVAKTDIEAYINSDFNDDYEGISFRISKGAILAIGKQEQFRINKNTDELATLPSIFSIVKKETQKRIGMQVDVESEKIIIGLNKVDFTNYQIICRMPALNSVMHSSLIFPALVYTFEQLKDNCEEYEDHRWYKSIVTIFKKYNVNFDNELLHTKTSIEIAQTLLDIPIERALASLISFNNVEEDDA